MYVKCFKLNFRNICMCACMYIEYYWKDTQKVVDYCLKGGK